MCVCTKSLYLAFGNIKGTLLWKQLNKKRSNLWIQSLLMGRSCWKAPGSPLLGPWFNKALSKLNNLFVMWSL